jgi:hypothetical protein
MGEMKDGRGPTGDCAGIGECMVVCTLIPSPINCLHLARCSGCPACVLNG